MGRPSITYAEFIQNVRKFRTVDVLEAVAAFSAGVSEPESGPDQWLQASPWGLAKIAKESIVAGSQFFRQAHDLSAREVLKLHNTFANTADVPRDMEEQELGRLILLQLSYEQFVYGQYDHDSWARSLAIMHFTPLRHPQIDFDESYIFDLFEMPISEAINGLWLMGQVCRLNRGIWRDDLLQVHDMQEVLKWVSLETLINLRKQISMPIQSFKSLVTETGESQGSPYRRWEANPLIAYPLVDLLDGRYVAPQYRLVSKLAAPDALAYRGFIKRGADFTTQLGPIFEQYVGDQLKLIGTDSVSGEIKFQHGKTKLASIDWFVELNDCILLVEVKSARPNDAVRSGRVDIKTAYKAALGRAYAQITETKKYIDSGRVEFQRYSTGKKLIGIVVTLEPFYLANSGLFLEYEQDSGLPILQASAAEIEELVLIEPQKLSELLLKIVSDFELARQDLTNSAKDYFSDRHNPFLLEAKNSIQIMNATTKI
jgi:hypothetical protein